MSASVFIAKPHPGWNHASLEKAWEHAREGAGPLALLGARCLRSELRRVILTSVARTASVLVCCFSRAPALSFLPSFLLWHLAPGIEHLCRGRGAVFNGLNSHRSVLSEGGDCLLGMTSTCNGRFCAKMASAGSLDEDPVPGLFWSRDYIDRPRRYR